MRLTITSTTRALRVQILDEAIDANTAKAKVLQALLQRTQDPTRWGWINWDRATLKRKPEA